MEIIIESLPRVPSFTITYESPRTATLPNAYLIRNIGSNPIRMLVALIRVCMIFSEERPTAVISTGSEIAIPAFLIGKLMRARCIFVESLTRVTRPSGSGFLLYPFSDLFLVQWSPLLTRYGHRAEQAGAIS